MRQPLSAGITFAWLMLFCGTTYAQNSDTPAHEALVEGARRSYVQSAYSRIRPGSYLSGEQPTPGPVAERRHELGIRRDEEVRTHYSRIAQLDVLADTATRSRNLSIAERIEATRRREIQRFLLAMQALQVDILRHAAQRGP